MLTGRPSRVLAVACLAWGMLGAVPADGAAPDAPPPPESIERSDDIPSLVRQLGDADFRTREAATRRLREIGKPAMPALREALSGDDPEVCSRADSLLRQIERPRIPAGWFRNTNGWRRSETLRNGTRMIDVREGGRRVQVMEGTDGIRMIVTGVDDGQTVHVTLQARDADDLRRQDPEAYEIYQRIAGVRSNLNLRGRRLGVPGVPMPLPLPNPVPMPRVAPRPPAVRLLPLAPEGGLLRPPGDDLLELEARLHRQMRGAGVKAAEQQAVLEALRMLRDIQAQGRLVPPADLVAQIRKYNALSDALRQKLDDLKLPGPGDALPPPARARLGVSVAAPEVEDDADGNGGVLVTMVIPGSRGEKLGLKAGDTIRQINGQRVDGPALLRRVLTDTNDPLVLDVVRAGEPTVLKEKKQ